MPTAHSRRRSRCFPGYRGPRRQEELDTIRGEGIVFNQLPHPIDLVRLLGGGVLRSVRPLCCVLRAACFRRIVL